MNPDPPTEGPRRDTDDTEDLDDLDDVDAEVVEDLDVTDDSEDVFGRGGGYSYRCTDLCDRR